MVLLCVSGSMHAMDVFKATVGTDGKHQNQDSAGMWCVQEGGLERCEACDARYHMSCLGYTGDPSGTWLCPECHLGGRGECAGATPLPLNSSTVGPLNILPSDIIAGCWRRICWGAQVGVHRCDPSQGEVHAKRDRALSP